MNEGTIRRLFKQETVFFNSIKIARLFYQIESQNKIILKYGEERESKRLNIFHAGD